MKPKKKDNRIVLTEEAFRIIEKKLRGYGAESERKRVCEIIENWRCDDRHLDNPAI
jgi:hypothetical protein